MNYSRLRLLGGVAFLTCALLGRVGANAPTGRYTVAGGTVYDTKTKLTWQQAVPTTKYAWSDAQTYCFGIGSTLGGTGWRLPTIKELQTIVDPLQASPPLIDPSAFPGTPVVSFWSSTPDFSSVNYAFVDDFGGSGISENATDSTGNSTRCVR